MRKLFPGILLLAALAAVVALYDPTRVPTERYGDVARRECAREAGSSKADQADCLDRKLVAKALQMQSSGR